MTAARLTLALTLALTVVFAGTVPAFSPAKVAKDAADAAAQYRSLVAKPTSQRNAAEEFLLGIAHYEGVADLGVKPDPVRARDRFLSSFEKGYALAAVHVLMADVRADKPTMFMEDAERFMREKMPREAKFATIRYIANQMISAGNMKLAEPYLKMLADYYNDPGAAVSLATIYRDGIDGARMDARLADYYLNKGCADPAANQSTRIFCEQFRKK